MFDDSQRLRDIPHLLDLLSHYADLGSEDRASWRDRLLQMEGIEIKELSRLHGELIAFEWIEQNTGQASAVKDGVLSACYRITLNGLREVSRLKGIEYVDKSPVAADRASPKFARRRKPKSDAVAIPEVALAE